MKTEISQIVTDTMLGIREGVGKARKSEFKDYIKSLIEANKTGLDMSLIRSPMLTDNIKQGFEANLYYSAHGGLEGSGIWGLFTLGGAVGSTKEESVRISVDMEFKSMDCANYIALKDLPVEKLESLIK